MQTRSPSLTWLRSFEAAARLLNFTEAGKELGLTQTAISLHIKSLEETLGCQLFVRRARHLSLSAMGEAYHHAISDALSSINLATTSLFGPYARQTITVRVPISTAALWLAPRLPQFSQANPGISIRLVSTIWATSISDEDVDVDIKQGLGNWPGLEAEKISTETIVPIKARLASRPAISDPAFHSVPLIQILGYEDMWTRYLAAHGLQNFAAAPAFIADTSVVAVAMVAANAGQAAIQTRFAQTAISIGADIAITGEPVPFPQSHYLVSGVSKRQRRPEVELFTEWLRGSFAD